MRKWLHSFWENYKYRFVPWIVVNLKHKKPQPLSSVPQEKPDMEVPTWQQQQLGQKEQSTAASGPSMIVHHVSQGEDKLLSDDVLVNILVNLFEKLLECEKVAIHKGEASTRGKELMHNLFGYSIERRKSRVGENAGTGVFLASGHAKPGSLIALYPGTVYMPSEPLFFQSLGNPFIFRCSDNVHIDGNDKWISKSIFKSCSARDKFRTDLPCCDESWLSTAPINPLNIGQYVNNRSKTHENNVVYQESHLTFGCDTLETQKSKKITNLNLPINLARYLPNVWASPDNNCHPLRVVPLVAVKEIKEGDEILSSYFTLVHEKRKKPNEVLQSEC